MQGEREGEWTVGQLPVVFGRLAPSPPTWCTNPNGKRLMCASQEEERARSAAAAGSSTGGSSGGVMSMEEYNRCVPGQLSVGYYTVAQRGVRDSSTDP